MLHVLEGFRSIDMLRRRDSMAESTTDGCEDANVKACGPDCAGSTEHREHGAAGVLSVPRGLSRV